MIGTEIFKIDASWAEKLTKTRVQFLLTPTVTVPFNSFMYPRPLETRKSVKYDG